jgi:hypothetical protein
MNKTSQTRLVCQAGAISQCSEGLGGMTSITTKYALGLLKKVDT